MVKRPSVLILCFYIIGVIASKYLVLDWKIILIVLFIIFCLYLLFLRYRVRMKRIYSKRIYSKRIYLKRKYSKRDRVFYFVLSVSLILGYILPGYYERHNELPPAVHGKIVKVLGSVDNVIPKQSYQEIYLNGVQIAMEGSLYTMNRIIVQDKSGIQITIGDRLLVKGKVGAFEQAVNPGQFDAKAFYEANGICYHIWDGQILKRSVSRNLFYHALNAIRRRVSNIYMQTLPKEDSDVLHAIVLGDKSELGQELKSLYQKAGISHILAISGLHISMIGLFMFRLLKKTGIHHNLASILCILLICAYGRMTGLSVSTNRAVVMMVLSLAACLVNRSYDSCSAIACSALIILLQQPYQLFQCGFLMSFLAVIGAVIFYPCCMEYINWCLPDFDRKMKRKEESEYYSLAVLIYRVSNRVRSGFLASVSIQIITLPVMLWFYYEVSPYAVILNLFVIPLASLLLLLAILLAAAGCISIPLAQFLGGGIHCILWFYQFLCQMFGKIPYSQLVIGKPQGWKVLVFVICTGGFMLLVKRRVHKAAGILLGIAGLVLLVRLPAHCLQITVLDVGQGDCIFVENEKGVTFLVDGGSTDVKQVGMYRIHPFLKYSGVRTLNYCFLTHMDEDHVCGVAELLDYARENQDFVLENLVLTKQEALEEKGQEVIKQAKKAGAHVLLMERDDLVRSGNLCLRCLHPYEGFQAEDRNSASMVLELGDRNFSMLLTGDVDEAGEEAILSYKGFRYRQYSLLKIAHHGSRYSSEKRFLDRVKAKWAIISCGENNRYGHPHQEVLERLENSNVRWFVTEQSGAVRIRVDGKGYTLWGYLDKERHRSSYNRTEN